MALRGRGGSQLPPAGPASGTSGASGPALAQGLAGKRGRRYFGGAGAAFPPRTNNRGFVLFPEASDEHREASSSRERVIWWHSQEVLHGRVPVGSGVVGRPPALHGPLPSQWQLTALCPQVVQLTWWAVCRDSVYYTLSVIVLIAVSSLPPLRSQRPAHLRPWPWNQRPRAPSRAVG